MVTTEEQRERLNRFRDHGWTFQSIAPRPDLLIHAYKKGTGFYRFAIRPNGTTYDWLRLTGSEGREANVIR